MVVTANFAFIAILPLNCPADVRESGAEASFGVGGKVGYCHRNDTNAADGSADATAVQNSYKRQVTSYKISATEMCYGMDFNPHPQPLLLVRHV